jgi:hypothetical protein
MLDGFYRRDGERRPSRVLDNRFKPVGRPFRRPSATNEGSMPRGNEESACAHKLGDPQLPRKAPVELTANVTVPQTDTGGRGEDPKALERTLPKELGKMTP